MTASLYPIASYIVPKFSANWTTIVRISLFCPLEGLWTRRPLSSTLAYRVCFQIAITFVLGGGTIASGVVLASRRIYPGHHIADSNPPEREMQQTETQRVRLIDVRDVIINRLDYLKPVIWVFKPSGNQVDCPALIVFPVRLTKPRPVHI
jgi:hypothetical protein